MKPYLIQAEKYRNEWIKERNKILDTWRYFFPYYRKKLKSIDYNLDLLDKVLDENLQN